jgi:hypothetical protein
MGPRRKTAALIQTLYPGRDRLIESALDEYPAFRELCEDYRRCASAVDRWQRQDGIEATSRHQEYAELLEELGLEIQAWLDAKESVSTRVKKRTT